MNVTDRTLEFAVSYGISHLSYADHVLIFTNAKEHSLTKIMDFLYAYAANAGQSINVSKSSFVMDPKAPTLAIHKVKRVTSFTHKPLPFTYLGAPICVGCRKTELFDPLMEAMSSRVAGWEKKFLSFGSRRQLIQSVLLYAYSNIIYLEATERCDCAYRVITKLILLWFN
ncbi:UNVERIFIED_CONTAM: hypothetical protein Slati_4220300 [Sesamum latifolium]|uniref:Reverse transcriptase domain-containing protein n=1 Tax=Sesamum latifolium TaxID=2727402 RepID=A0AAW2TAX5_9LAMI